MKFSSLKKQDIHSFKVPKLCGGMNIKTNPRLINDNQLSFCKNMWYKDNALKTRPGFLANIKKAYTPQIYGYNGELEYKVTDNEVYIDEKYYRIATADIETDDYAHYTYVYLIDLEKNIKPIGNMAFLRISSDIFYRPINILFYSGKSKKGGIFAFVTLANRYNLNEKSYHIYEVNKKLTEWQRVYDYYIPTVLINGTGNKYQTAKAETGLVLPNPKTLESQNMLNGRFSAYFSSDGYSTSFNLPFSNISSENVVCRIYYTFTDYVEWQIPATANTDTQQFFGDNVKAVIDREMGVLYFVGSNGAFPIPLMELYNENNIKVTATKEITDGFAKIVYSTCSARYNTRLLISGGDNGNTVYTCDYNNPLYFPQSSSQSVGEGSNAITALKVFKDKICAFKSHDIYLLSLKEGEIINEVSLLNDNDASFNQPDDIMVDIFSENIGAITKETITSSNKMLAWLGTDNKIYAIDSYNNKQVKIIYEFPKEQIMEDFQNDAFGMSDGNNYIFINCNGIFFCDAENLKQPKIYYWQKPSDIIIGSGFYHNGEFYFLCGDNQQRIVFVTTLSGEVDNVLYLEDGSVKKKNVDIESNVTTKHFDLCGFETFKNIDSIYLLLSAHKKVKICVNDREVANINVSSSDFESVKLLPHLYGVNNLYLTLSSTKPMSIGEIEIIYRITG